MTLPRQSLLRFAQTLLTIQWQSFKAFIRHRTFIKTQPENHSNRLSILQLYSGMQPHIHHIKLTAKCVDLCQMTLTEVKNMVIDVRKAMCNNFEEKAFENGIVMMQTLAEMLSAYHKIWMN
jgi:hypothetical protein